jgi:membrane fusion protein (multidrug efflux system)
MKNRIYILVIILLLTGCSKEMKEREESTNSPVLRVTTVPVLKQEYTPVKSFSGTLKAWREANLGAVLPGKVESILIDEGKDVKEGDIIAELSDELLQQAQIELNTIEKDYERITRLFEKKAVSEQDFDHTKALYDATLQKYNLIRQNTRITAPFDGTIVEHLVNEGENYLFGPALSPGYSHAPGVVRLMQLDTLKVIINVNENEISRLKIGQTAELISGNDEIYKGRITHIGLMLSEMTKSGEVEIMILNHRRTLKPGMYADVLINYPSEKGIFIPRYCVLKTKGTGQDYVYIAEAGKAVRRDIEIISSREDLVNVKGISATDTIIKAGKNNVSNGTAIEIVQE